MEYIVCQIAGYCIPLNMSVLKLDRITESRVLPNEFAKLICNPILTAEITQKHSLPMHSIGPYQNSKAVFRLATDQLELALDN